MFAISRARAALIASPSELSRARKTSEITRSLSKPLFSAAPREDYFEKNEQLDVRLKRFQRWMQDKLPIAGNQNRELSIVLPAMRVGQLPDAQRRAENEKTIVLFKQHFHDPIWTGLEGSDPIHTSTGQRFELNRTSGLYNPFSRKQQIRALKELGIENVRVALPYPKIADEGSWAVSDAILSDLKEAGLHVSLDGQHFGLPTQFHDPTHPEKSDYLNPDWPDHYAEFVSQAFARYHEQFDAFTLINEPMVTISFSGNHWNEGMPGWGHPDFNHYFIDRALYVGEATTKARAKIEAYIQMSPEPEKARRIFLHNEAIDWRTDYPDGNQFRRFLASDLILGADWLLKGDGRGGDFHQTPMYNYLIRDFVRPGHRESDIKRLDEGLNKIRKLHLDFQERYQKTMRADTVFGLDYYMTNEGGRLPSGETMPEHPQDYGKYLAQGQRKGLYGVTMDFWDRYQLPLVHAETNTADAHAKLWGYQQLAEMEQLIRTPLMGNENEHPPVLGVLNWYSLMDQHGWMPQADYIGLLSCPPEQAQQDPNGLLDLQFNKRVFAREILPELRQALDGNERQNTSPSTNSQKRSLFGKGS
jgi:hypothetical protein